LLTQNPKRLDLYFREKHLETPVLPVLNTRSNVAEAKQSRAHIVDIFVGVLQPRFPAYSLQKFEGPG